MSDLVTRLREYELSEDYVIAASKEAPDRITTLENTLRQAREALGNEPRYTHIVEALAAIDAVLSGAPPSEITDERILEIAKQTPPVTPWQLEGSIGIGNIQKQVIAFARAVLKEGK